MIPIEMSFRTLNDPQFIQSLKGLVNHKFDDFTVAYKLTKIMNLAESQSEIASNLWNKHQSKIEFVPVDETQPEGPKKPKNMSAFKDFEEGFLNTKCDVGNRHKIEVSDLVGYKLSAVDMVVLKPILTGFEALETEPIGTAQI